MCNATGLVRQPARRARPRVPRDLRDDDFALGMIELNRLSIRADIQAAAGSEWCHCGVVHKSWKGYDGYMGRK